MGKGAVCFATTCVIYLFAVSCIIPAKCCHCLQAGQRGHQQAADRRQPLPCSQHHRCVSPLLWLSPIMSAVSAHMHSATPHMPLASGCRAMVGW